MLRRQDGVSLIEILIGIAIIGVCVGMYMVIQQMNWASVSKSSKVYRVIGMMEQEVENIKGAVRSNPDDSFPPQPRVVTGDGITLTIDTSSVMNNQSPPEPIDNLVRVIMTAQWGAGLGKDSMQVSTNIARNY